MEQEHPTQISQSSAEISKTTKGRTFTVKAYDPDMAVATARAMEAEAKLNEYCKRKDAEDKNDNKTQ